MQNLQRNKDHTPVYAAIYTAIRTKIFNGQLAPGDLLPSENHLCHEFHASRETVRKGLHQLESEGLIFSKPKIGYYVSQPNHHDMVLSLSDNLSNCIYQYRDIHGILPNDRMQEILQIPANRKVIEFSQIGRSADGTPVAYDVKYVPYERAYPSVEKEIRYAVLPDLTFSKMAAFTFYTEVSVNAVSADESVAAVLECPIGTPLLLIEQIFIEQNGSRFAYQLHYSRSPHGSLTGTSGHRQ